MYNFAIRKYNLLSYTYIYVYNQVTSLCLFSFVIVLKPLINISGYIGSVYISNAKRILVQFIKKKCLEPFTVNYKILSFSPL